jgi:hypothetical protein
VLPGGHCHSHFPQKWQFLKAEWPGKFVAVKVAMTISYIFHQNYCDNKIFSENLKCFCKNRVYFARKCSPKRKTQIFAKIYISTLVGETWQHWFSMTTFRSSSEEGLK